jgi:G3E family GTPase
MFQQAAAMDWPLMRCLRLENMVTVVDASAFLSEYHSADKMAERPDLLGPDAALVAEVSPLLSGGVGAAAVAEMGVVQLLVEQVETADVLVLNKADVASEADMVECVTPSPVGPGGGARWRWIG